MFNYFTFFELPAAFEVDISELERRYFAVQRACHPDRLVGKPATERQQAITRSMQANEAFEVLKTPLLRARHLLALQDIHVGSEKDSVKPSHALLMDIMEIRETLEEVTTAQALAALKTNISAQMERLLATLASTFAAQQWSKAAEHTLRYGYLTKIAEEVRLKGKALS